LPPIPRRTAITIGLVLLGIGLLAVFSSTLKSLSTALFATSTPSATITPTQSPTDTPTPTATPTERICELEVEKKVSANGVVTLVVCWKEGFYEIGDLAQGLVAVGPNKKFFVYVTSYAEVFAARVGKPNLTKIAKLKRLFHYTNVRDEPNFDLQFSGNHPNTLVVIERHTNEKESILLPRYITTPQE